MRRSRGVLTLVRVLVGEFVEEERASLHDLERPLDRIRKSLEQTLHVDSVSLAELAELTGPLGLKVERDPRFQADLSLSRYGSDAIRSGAIRA